MQQMKKQILPIGLAQILMANPVELISISDLTIHPFVEAHYKQGNLTSLKESMKTDSQLHEIFYDVKNRVFIGARRLAAAKELGWTHVRARRVDITDEPTLHQLTIASNQQRIKSFSETMNEAMYMLGVIGTQQGKKRELLLDESDPQFENIKSDRFAIAAKYCGIEVSGNTLRKAVCICDFELKYPDNGLNLIDMIERKLISIDRAYILTKQFNELKAKGGETSKEKADAKNFADNSNWTIYNQSCLKMSHLADGEVATIATSIPYYGLRDYRTPEEIAAAKAAGDESELGQEKTVEKFLENLKPYLLEMKRVLNDKGSLWINVGDTYSNSINYLVSHRVVMLAAEVGFHLISEVIFHQASRIPQNTNRRLQPSYERLYHLVKSNNDGKEVDYNYYPYKVEDVKKRIAPYKIKRPNKNGTFDEGDYNLSKPYKKFCDFLTLHDQDDIIRNCNVQSESSALKKVFGESHIAPYSTSLMLLPILTTTKPGDLVADPFGGSGSTLVTAILMGRKAIMYEKQERFAELAKKRLALVSKEVNLEQAEKIEGLVKGNITIDVKHFVADASNPAKKRVSRKKAA